MGFQTVDVPPVAAFTPVIENRLQQRYCLPCSHERSGQSGRGAENPREVSANSPAIREFVDQVHAWVVYRREVMRTPQRALADEIGISRSAVDKFHRLRSHPGKNWPRLRDWYMRTRRTKPDEYQTPPELMIASAMQLLSAVPSEFRASAMQATVEHYKQIYAGLPHQEWIQMLAELADQESRA